MASEQVRRLGARAKERRVELDLKQREVADRMTDRPNVDSQVISKWERGQHRPNDANLEAWATALETTVPDLMAGPLAERTSRGPTPDLGDIFAPPSEAPQWAQELRERQDEILERQDIIIGLLHALGAELPDEAAPSTGREAA